MFGRPQLVIVMGIRKRTIYIDVDLDKEFAKAANDAEVTYSKMAKHTWTSQNDQDSID
jgi:hypothetical protein